VLLQELPDEFVVVNVAGFNLYFLRGQDIVWTTRVQVGKPYRQTPIFRSEINYLVFNPTWTVPPGIIKNDILPAARQDAGVFARKKLKVLDSSGREIDPHAIDWSKYKSGNIPYTLRQDPGADNALGRVKLMFPNPYLVYLHDTPSQSLFERSDRAFSSGCVRVKDALKLAELVLDDESRWNPETIGAVIAGGQLQNVTLKRKVPVLLAYWTAWVDSNGVMNFRKDVYGQDAKWGAALDIRPSERPAEAREQLVLERVCPSVVDEVELEPAHPGEDGQPRLHTHFEPGAEVGQVVRRSESQNVGCIKGLTCDREATVLVELVPDFCTEADREYVAVLVREERSIGARPEEDLEPVVTERCGKQQVAAQDDVALLAQEEATGSAAATDIDVTAGIAISQLQGIIA
jgi:hypothetical protein